MENRQQDCTMLGQVRPQKVRDRLAWAVAAARAENSAPGFEVQTPLLRL